MPIFYIWILIFHKPLFTSISLILLKTVFQNRSLQRCKKSSKIENDKQAISLSDFFWAQNGINESVFAAPLLTHTKKQPCWSSHLSSRRHNYKYFYIIGLISHHAKSNPRKRKGHFGRAYALPASDNQGVYRYSP